MLLSGSAIAQTYSNAAGFSVGTAVGPFTPYSSTITVAGGPATVGALTIDIIGLSHTWPSDIDVMLVGPNGDAMIIMSDAGSGTDVVNVNYSIFDGAATAFNLTQNLSGSYRPYNNGTIDGMPAPAPAVYGDAAPAGAGTLRDRAQFPGNLPRAPEQRVSNPRCVPHQLCGTERRARRRLWPALDRSHHLCGCQLVVASALLAVCAAQPRLGIRRQPARSAWRATAA